VQLMVDPFGNGMVAHLCSSGDGQMRSGGIHEMAPPYMCWASCLGTMSLNEPQRTQPRQPFVTEDLEGVSKKLY
jgi:hypothetical protein